MTEEERLSRDKIIVECFKSGEMGDMFRASRRLGISCKDLCHRYDAIKANKARYEEIQKEISGDWVWDATGKSPPKKAEK